jgi:hypothetical protein
MDAWLQKLMEGLDPQAPDLAWQIFLRLMGLVDWWLLFWLSLIFIAVGGLIGWFRGTFWRDVGLAAALGPLGWVMSFLLPPPTRPCVACHKLNPVAALRCARCGAQLRSAPAPNPPT